MAQSSKINDLETSLADLAQRGEAIHYIKTRLSPDLEIASHYSSHAGVPATSKSKDEGVFVYTGCRIPVLMGLFGSRKRNNILLVGSEEVDKRALARQLANPIPPRVVTDAPCQQQVGHISTLSDLPILRYTKLDAGPYIISGIVYAKHPIGNAYNASIHRLCVVDDSHCTIWMVPGRHLEVFYLEAAKKGQALPVSINIGGDPIVYLTSSFSPPCTRLFTDEMGIAGAIRQRPLEVTRCVTTDALCFAQSDIVLEAEITCETADEGKTGYSMPEFLGYMGGSKSQLPLVRIKVITTKKKPMYQTFLGPGREQSELLAIPQELSIISATDDVSGIHVVDVHCPSYSGGLLAAVVKIVKTSKDADANVITLGRRILDSHKYVKNIYVTDMDIDIYSPEDVFWAMTTRMQPDIDLHVITNAPGFPMDPSQTSSYRNERSEGYNQLTTPVTTRNIFDCTYPYRMKQVFCRASFGDCHDTAGKYTG